MRIFAAILMLALSVAAQEKAQGPSALEGTVLDARTGKPIAGAMVNPIPFNANGTFTNEKGGFVLGPLTPGRFRLLVDSPGHLAQAVVIDIADGERRKGVEIRLEQTGVISGRVVDSNGQPITRVFPQTLVYTHRWFPGSGSNVIAKWDQTDVTLTSVFPGRSTGTDDRGEFRIFNLPPGEYYLGFSRQNGSAAIGTFLYPGVMDRFKAIPIRVRAGEEVRLADTTLTPSILAPITAHIAIGEKPQFPFAYRLALLDPKGEVLEYLTQRGEPPMLSLSPGAPGQFMVCASTENLDESLGAIARSCRAVDYTGAAMDLEFKLTKLDGQLTGRVLVVDHDGVTAMPTQEITFTTDTMGKSGEPLRVVSKPDGSFAESGLPLGIGRITSLRRLSGQGIPNYYLASVRQGDRDVLTEGIIISDQKSNVEVFVSPLSGVVRGKVIDADGHVLPNATVALVPEGDLLKRSDLNDTYRTDQADIDGIYEIRGLIPGSYRAYAATRPEGWAYWDSEYMKQFDAVGKTIQIEKGGSISADLTATLIDIESTK